MNPPKQTRKEAYNEWKEKRTKENNRITPNKSMEKSRILPKRQTESLGSSTNISIDENSKEYLKFELYNTKKQVIDLLKHFEDKLDRHFETATRETVVHDGYKSDPPKVIIQTEAIPQIREAPKDTTLLVTKIAELESLVKKLSIERDLWRYRAEMTLDPNISLQTSIIGGLEEEEDLNLTTVRQHALLDKIKL
jgi:hypothetical protein